MQTQQSTCKHALISMVQSVSSRAFPGLSPIWKKCIGPPIQKKIYLFETKTTTFIWGLTLVFLMSIRSCEHIGWTKGMKCEILSTKFQDEEKYIIIYFITWIKILSLNCCSLDFLKRFRANNEPAFLLFTV